MIYSPSDRILLKQAALAILQGFSADPNMDHLDMDSVWAMADKFVRAQPTSISDAASIARSGTPR